VRDAAPPAESPSTTPSSDATKREQCLLFRCADDTYALPVTDVYKVVDLTNAVNRLPRLSRRVVGITQHRGRILTVLDARVLLDVDDDDDSWMQHPLSRILVLDRAQRGVGILVHAVGEISQLPVPVESSGRLLTPVTFRSAVVHVIDTDRLMQQALETGDLDQATPAE